MAAAVFFLLLGTWMEELALIGIRSAAIVGIGALVCSAVAVNSYRHACEARAPGVALAALARTTRAASTPRRPATVRLVR
jgi:hypothetical protein